jgi:hypothetical protein
MYSDEWECDCAAMKKAVNKRAVGTSAAKKLVRCLRAQKSVSRENVFFPYFVSRSFGWGNE